LGSTGLSNVAACQTKASDGILGGMANTIKPRDSGVASAFWFLGGVNGLVAVIGLIVGFSGGNTATAYTLLVGGFSGMIVCFAVASVVQHLCEIAWRLEVLQNKADSLETNNQLLRQLLRAYGHEPEV